MILCELLLCKYTMFKLLVALSCRVHGVSGLCTNNYIDRCTWFLITDDGEQPGTSGSDQSQDPPPSVPSSVSTLVN